MTFFFDNSKKALAKSPSSSKAISNHPPLNDKPRSDPGSRHHDSPKKEPTTMFPWKVTQTIPPQSGIRHHDSPKKEPTTVCTHAPVAKDDAHTRNFQPTREPMEMFPWKVNPTIPPQSGNHVPSDRAAQTSMVLSKEKKELQSQLLAMQDVLDAALNTSEARRKEIERLKEDAQRHDSIVISMVSAEKIAGNKISELERKFLQRDENIRNLEQKLRISQEQHSQTTKLLEDRTAELKGAQAFLTTADRYSGADIIKMAESLNAEIFQASAMIAELLVDAPVVEDSVQHRQHIQKYGKHLEHCRKQIGSQLFDHLTAKSKEIRVDPLPLQLAFQALFTSWCVYEVNQFCEGRTGESLKEIYGRIYKSETQAVAGRWRAMTSVQTMNSDAPSNANFVFHIILGLMLICGGFGSKDTSQKAKVSVQQAVLRVEKMWKTLKAATMQEITAAEITTIVIGPGSDYNADKMDDMYIDASSDVITNPDNLEQHILCPVGVGLRRDVSKRCQDGTIQINGEMILKPKIALASVLLKGEPSPDTQMMLDGKD